MNNVSIIIPAYNAYNTLRESVESCLEQKNYLKEIIIIDDFSTDETWNLICELKCDFPSIIFGYKNLSKGGNIARNFGFSLSTGDFIQWLDADDLIINNKLKYQLEKFKYDSELDIIYSDWILRTINKNSFIDENHFETQTNDFLLKLLKDDWMPPHSYLIKRKAAVKISELNGWNPKTSVLQDREYFTIAALLGLQYGYVSGLFSVYNRNININSVSKKKQTEKSSSLLNIMNNLISIIETNKLQHIKSIHISYIKTNIMYSEMLSKTKSNIKINFNDIKFQNFYGRTLLVKLLFYFIKRTFSIGLSRYET